LHPDPNKPPELWFGDKGPAFREAKVHQPAFYFGRGGCFIRITAEPIVRLMKKVYPSRLVSADDGKWVFAEAKLRT
jgi:hypothetical protein